MFKVLLQYCDFWGQKILAAVCCRLIGGEKLAKLTF